MRFFFESEKTQMARHSRLLGSRARVTTSAYLVTLRASIPALYMIGRYPEISRTTSLDATVFLFLILRDGETRRDPPDGETRAKRGLRDAPRSLKIRVDVIVVDDLFPLGRLIRQPAAAAAFLLCFDLVQ